MRCRTTSLATLLLAVPVFGQITLDADDLRIPIGARYSLTATSMRGESLRMESTSVPPEPTNPST